MRLAAALDVDVDGQHADHLGQDEGQAAEVEGPAVRVVVLLLVVPLRARLARVRRDVHDDADDVAQACCHEQDARPQDDVPLGPVHAGGRHAHAPQQQQDGAEDGEDAGGPDHSEQILRTVMVVVRVLREMVDLHADTSFQPFQAADAPEAGVREAAGVAALGRRPAVRRALVGREVGGVADEGARVQPVVRADGDGHEAEGGEGAHRGHQHLHALLAPQPPLLVPALQRLQPDRRQPGGRGPPAGQRGRRRAGGGRAQRANGGPAPGAWGAGAAARTRLGPRGQRAAMVSSSVSDRSTRRRSPEHGGGGAPSPVLWAPPFQRHPVLPSSHGSPSSPGSRGPRRPTRPGVIRRGRRGKGGAEVGSGG